MENIGLGGCRITECLIAYFNMVTVCASSGGQIRENIRLYICTYILYVCSCVELQRFHCIRTYMCMYVSIFLFCCHCVLVSDGVLEHVVVYSCVVFPTRR